MQLSTTQIKDAGPLLLDEEIQPQQLLGTPPDFITFDPPLKVHVRAYKTEREFVVTGTAKMNLKLVCARCLEAFEKEMTVEFQQVFDPGTEFIDISSDIREAVFVDLPLKAVCKETCKGLCPSCGKNRNLTACVCKTQKGSLHWDSLQNFPFK
jgi:uncharacterized protein